MHYSMARMSDPEAVQKPDRHMHLSLVFDQSIVALFMRSLLTMVKELLVVSGQVNPIEGI